MIFKKAPLKLKEIWRNLFNFDWGVKQPCPYIWVSLWLITFDPFEISFMPD